MALLRPSLRAVRLGLAALCLLTGGARAGAAEPAAPAAEYQVKAVFLFNFAQFVEWPPAAFADGRAPLVIGVVGEDPFGSYLDDLVRSEKIGDRSLVVRRYAGLGDVTGCHVLFVSRALAGEFDRIAPLARREGILTVSDAETFNRMGGIVRFATERGRIHLRVNIDVAKASGLTISSKLLRWATIVTSEKN